MTGLIGNKSQKKIDDNDFKQSTMQEPEPCTLSSLVVVKGSEHFRSLIEVKAVIRENCFSWGLFYVSATWQQTRRISRLILVCITHKVVDPDSLLY